MNDNNFNGINKNDENKENVPVQNDSYNNYYDPNNPYVNQTQEKHVPKCFTVFAKLGFGLSLAGLIGCWIPYFFMISIPGIVFSILGKRSLECRGKASTGLVLGIIGCVVGFILTIIILAILYNELSDYGNYYY